MKVAGMKMPADIGILPCILIDGKIQSLSDACVVKSCATLSRNGAASDRTLRGLWSVRFSVRPSLRQNNDGGHASIRRGHLSTLRLRFFNLPLDRSPDLHWVDKPVLVATDLVIHEHWSLIFQDSDDRAPQQPDLPCMPQSTVIGAVQQHVFPDDHAL